MALLKFLKRKEEGVSSLPTWSTLQGSTVTKAQLREANKAVLEAVEDEVATKRGKYNHYTPEQRARIGRYAAENGGSRAALHFSAMLDVKVSSYVCLCMVKLINPSRSMNQQLEDLKKSI